MQSAFGVEHGYDEIEKAFGPGLSAIGSAVGRGTKKLGQLSRTSSAAQMRVGRKMGGPVGRLTQQGGARGVRLGGQIRRLGAGMQQRPGFTGAATLTAGGAGIAGGSAYMNRRRY